MLCYFSRFYDYIRYDIPYGISNLCSWFKVVWKFRAWDSHYVFVMLRKSLQELYPVIRDGCHLNGEKDASRIKICINLLDRIISDSSCGKFTYFQMHPNDEKAAYTEKNDIEYLFMILTKHIKRWWE
jgi:hypothetical protein